MKKELKNLWEWEGIDYLIQIAGILIFASAFLHFQGANQTLDNDGCSVYWDEYKGVNQSQVLFLNSSEKADLREKQEPEPGKYRGNNQSLNFTD